MARRRGRRYHRRGGKIPIVSLAILGGQAAYAWSQNNGGGVLGALDAFQSLYTGIGFGYGHAQFDAFRYALGYGPWLAKRFLMPLARPRLPPSTHLPISLS